MPSAIADQPTSTGRRLHLARAVTPDGHLLLPYGDYTDNTGPIDVIGYRPGDGDVVTYLDGLADEKITGYRVLNGGAIWSCNTDPRGRDEAETATNAGGTWHAVTISVAGKGPAIHLFDVAQTSDDVLYACGARNLTIAEAADYPQPFDYEGSGVAFVWRSVNGGADWTEDLAVVNPADGYWRFYGFGKIGDTLYVGASDGSGFWRRNESGWSDKNLGVLPIYDPPLWTIDAFVIGSTVWTDPGGNLTGASTAGSPSSVVFDWSESTGYLRADTRSQVWDGPTLLGTLPDSPPPYLWSGTRGIDGEVYLCDGDAIYLLPPPD